MRSTGWTGGSSGLPATWLLAIWLLAIWLLASWLAPRGAEATKLLLPPATRPGLCFLVPVLKCRRRTDGEEEMGRRWMASRADNSTTEWRALLHSCASVPVTKACYTAICIAVIHHLSSESRRVAAVQVSPQQQPCAEGFSCTCLPALLAHVPRLAHVPLARLAQVSLSLLPLHAHGPLPLADLCARRRARQQKAFLSMCVLEYVWLPMGDSRNAEGTICLRRTGDWLWCGEACMSRPLWSGEACLDAWHACLEPSHPSHPIIAHPILHRTIRACRGG